MHCWCLNYQKKKRDSFPRSEASRCVWISNNEAERFMVVQFVVREEMLNAIWIGCIDSKLLNKMTLEWWVYSKKKDYPKFIKRIDWLPVSVEFRVLGDENLEEHHLHCLQVGREWLKKKMTRWQAIKIPLHPWLQSRFFLFTI